MEHSSLTLRLLVLHRPFDLLAFCGVPRRQQYPCCSILLLTAVASCTDRLPLVAGSICVLWLVAHRPLHFTANSRSTVSCGGRGTQHRTIVGIVPHPTPIPCHVTTTYTHRTPHPIIASQRIPHPYGIPHTHTTLHTYSMYPAPIPPYRIPHPCGIPRPYDTASHTAITVSHDRTASYHDAVSRTS